MEAKAAHSEPEQIRESLQASSEKLAEQNEELRRLKRALAQREAEIARLEEQLRTRDVTELKGQLRALQVRVERLHSLLPVRLYNRLRGVPPVSWIVAKRTHGYYKALAELPPED